MTKKIAHICTSGTSYKILQDKLSLLAQKGFEVHFISSSDGGEIVPFGKQLSRHYIEVNRSIHLIDDVKSILAMTKLFKKARFDIVHTHTAKAGFIGRIAAKIAGVPLIIHTCHGLPFFPGQSKAKYYLFRFLELLASKFCDYVGSQNYEDIKILKKHLENEKLYYEGNGVNLKHLDAIRNSISDADLSRLKEEHNIPSGCRIILVGARFEPVKDHFLLIESLQLLKAQGDKSFCCLLAGTGPLENELRKKVNESGLDSHVKFLGFQQNIHPWIKLADLVVLTSQKEGIPRIVMESMAFEKSIVATDVPGTRELVRHNVTGLLSPYGDAKELARNMACLLKNDDLRVKFSAAGRKRIEEYFTEELVVERIIKLYDSGKKWGGNGARNSDRYFPAPVYKRLLDLVGATFGIVLAGPLMLAVALTIALTMGRPVIFRQIRPGLHGKPFAMYKFRTMLELYDEQGNLLPDEQRLPLIGRVLRSTSLDELPELFNVLKGEMSLVGPRPLLMGYLDRYTPEQARRHEVKPGITGWAQINGRNALSWEEKFKLDIWYVDNWNLFLDLKIIWITLGKVLRRDGISAEGTATMPEFMGSKQYKHSR